jgi:hypothetical protein
MLVALAPIAFVFFLDRCHGPIQAVLLLVFAFSCVGSHFLFGFLKPMWVRVIAAFGLAVVFFVVDVSAGVYIGCATHPLQI